MHIPAKSQESRLVSLGRYSMRLIFVAGNLMVLLLLPACIGQHLENYPDVRRSELLTMQDWSLQGKLAVRSDQGNASLRFSWAQTREKFDLILTGPLGQVLARVSGERGKVTLLSAGNEPVISEDVESLIFQLWGWQLPVNQMRFWVRGLPAPDVPHDVDYHADGSTRKLQQLGWQVRYLRYREGLPVRLELLRSAVKLLLVVKEWHLQEPANHE